MVTFIVVVLVLYVIFNAIMTLRLMFYWQAKEQRRMRWRDVWNVLNGDWDNG